MNEMDSDYELAMEWYLKYGGRGVNMGDRVISKLPEYKRGVVVFCNDEMFDYTMQLSPKALKLIKET